MQPKRPVRNNKNKKLNNKNRLSKNIFFWLGLFFLLLYILRLDSFSPQAVPKELTYGEFYKLVEGNRDTGAITSVVKVDDRIKGVFSSGAKFMVYVPQEDSALLKLLRENVPNFDVKPPKTLWANLF